ncbi:MAG: M20/M25/M40 family metallo-hydrolase [Acidobacteriia bacterium]|nr:M20/M25/M40 family metallo-hydrolase [Terriglobia bacterium]
MTAVTPDVFARLDSYVEKVRPEFEEKFAALVEIPTISMDPEHQADMPRGANLAAELMREAGASEVDVIPTDGNPVILGKFITDPSHPTVTIYNHMDVQPAQEPEWTREPFKFDKQGDRYFGRGTTDDKGPGMTALYGARYAIENGIPININLLWEMEEEIGSPSFDKFLKANAARAACDSIIVSDTEWIARGCPAIPYGLRGVQGLTVHLETAATDVHSGTAGGAARNPIAELGALVNDCMDVKTGRVKIPGFYKDVVPPTKKEIDSFLKSGFTVKHFKQALGLKKMRTEKAPEVLKRIFAMPTFEIHGLVGGYTGPGVKTVIPPRAELKITMRLVPKQKAEKIFKLVSKFIKSKIKDVVIKKEGSLEAYLGPFSGPLADAGRRAMKFAFGKDPAFTREGGSIGAVVTMEKYLKAPILFLGLSLPEHGYHAPNENFDWEQASGGIKMFAKYFDEISRMPRKK